MKSLDLYKPYRGYYKNVTIVKKKTKYYKKDPFPLARGFGMRVVGGKTGADGRLFAYIVWTVPGGPAEKGGLQQGDKVLEWCGVPLTDRSFEEVCAIMDRTGDVAELLVEHATDFRMCDLLEEPMPMINRKSSDASAIGLQIGEEIFTIIFSFVLFCLNISRAYSQLYLSHTIIRRFFRRTCLFSEIYFIELKIFYRSLKYINLEWYFHLRTTFSYEYREYLLWKQLYPHNYYFLDNIRK